MTGPVPIAVPIRVHLAHAAVQYLAAEAGTDLLHIKGPAVSVELRLRTSPGPDGEPISRAVPRLSTDVDVLVRPEHVDLFIATLRAHGWDLYTQFETGSLFEHAATLWHDHLGYVDVHRRFPGVEIDPGAAFDRIWAEREQLEIAHQSCAVPTVDMQRLILLLHCARGGGINTADSKLWTEATDDQRARCQALADELGAQVALAAATGRLDEYPDDPSARLWRILAAGGIPNRLDEWMGRFAAAQGVRERARVVRMALAVNTDHLAMRLGHQPNTAEVIRYSLQRFAHLASAAGHIARRRLDRRRS